MVSPGHSTVQSLAVLRRPKTVIFENTIPVSERQQRVR
jgi:hypothetical protein